jgi:hypothetical protein
VGAARSLQAKSRFGLRLYLRRIDPPHLLKPKTAQPDRAQTDAKRISSGSDKLRGHLIGRRVDPRERRAEIGDPHRSRAYRDVAAVARSFQSDRRNHRIGRRVDPRNAAISLIEDPDRTKTAARNLGFGPTGMVAAT